MERRDSEENLLVIDEGRSSDVEDGQKKSAEGPLEAAREETYVSSSSSEKLKLTFRKVSAPKPRQEINKGPEPEIRERPHTSKKMQTFKLDALRNLTATSLSVSAKLSEFYNMRLVMLPGSILGAELLSQSTPTASLPDITVDQLLNWPCIATTLTLRDFTFIRRIIPNYTREIVFGTDPKINLDRAMNVTETRRITVPHSNKPGQDISTKIFESYIAATEDAINLIEISKSRSAELETIFQRMKDDFKAVPNIFLKTVFSRFLNREKYMRTFDNDKDYKEGSGKLPKVTLREVINPEVQFSIYKCTFLNDNLPMWDTEFCSYFKKIFVKNDKEELEALRDTIKKCISFTCSVCNLNFHGALCMYECKAHLAKHYYDKAWTCVNCDMALNQFELTKNNWVHTCEGKENEAT